MNEETTAAMKVLGVLFLLSVLVAVPDPVLMWFVVWAAMSGTWTFWTVYAAWMLLVSLVCTGALIRYLFFNLPKTPASPTK